MKTKKFSNLFKKLKKTNKPLRYTFLISTITYLLSIVLLTYSLILLQGIENLIRILAIITLFLYCFIYLVSGLASLISKKHKTLTIMLILTLLFSIINILAFYHINKTYNIVEDIAKKEIVYTTNLIKLKTYTGDIQNVGLKTNEKDVEGHILPQEYMVNNNTKYKLTYYDTNEELLNALYEGKEHAIFITSNYVIKYGEDEKYNDIGEVTEVVGTLSKKMNNQDTVVSSNKDVTEPFTVLLLGVDSKYDGLNNNAAFNGDSIMMITFNPKTLSATIFSIPRDTYVPIACNNNKSYKINSASGYGTKCMIDTVQNLTDINIDYYVKINFKGVVALVNALNGITLDVEKPDFNKNWGHDCKGMICEQSSNRNWGNETVYVPVGKDVTLNGEQALAYSRNRHQWASSDFKRIEHQQAVVTAIGKKAKSIRDVQTFYKVLNSITNNIDSNMPANQMLNFYNVFKDALIGNTFGDDEFITIQRTNLAGYDLTLYTNGYNTYTFQYYEDSLEEIKKAMKENLEIQKPELIKTFNFSVNDEYTVPVIGKNFTANKRNETLPDFTDKKVQYVKDWASSRNITVDINTVDSNSCIQDSIIKQYTHKGTLVNTITSLKVDVCKNITIDDINKHSNIDDSQNNSNGTGETKKETENKNEEIDNIVEDIVN